MRSGKNRQQIATKPQKKSTLDLPPAFNEETIENNATKLEPRPLPRFRTSKLFLFLKDPMAAIYTIPDYPSALPKTGVKDPIKDSLLPLQQKSRKMVSQRRQRDLSLNVHIYIGVSPQQ
ncbi:hypothetical protein NDU88_005594 [Pleurodeles waltl]|uniref:Uncharacterized protein n=1 Tax=Pleurodeles waltl TaxID=8319 RepID=A0AAV7LNA0_PLEWA|nr:hypothetical protein NDU88_005594 [Pleurodeles waltl]